MDKNNPKISVIIPIYNVEKYLARCLDSIILQTYENLEIICVNDGSTDSSLKILENYARRDKRIKIMSQEHQGQSSARNAAMSTMTGDYFSFIDSDDWLQLSAYQKFVDILKCEDRIIDIFMFNGFNYFQDKKVVYSEVVKVFDVARWGNFKQSHFKIFREYKIPQNYAASIWNKLYRTEWFRQYNFQFFEGKIFEDRLFCAQTFLATDNVYVLEDYLYCYRRQPQSTCYTLNENVFDILTMSDEVKKVYKEYNFFEQSKYSFLEYLLREIIESVSSIRADLQASFLQEARKRLNEQISELDTEQFTQNENYELCQDILHLDCSMLNKKYHNTSSVIWRVQ